MSASTLQIIDLGRMAYRPAFDAQSDHLDEVLASRQAGEPEIGRILVVEHDPPVITVSRRPGCRDHLLVDERRLGEMGIEVCETDRGGDITYHGPGQLVLYPIIDLQAVTIRLHEYLRLLEQCVIETCQGFGLDAERDCEATGVWIRSGDQLAKVCAIGVRVRRWITMHGLAINVTTDLDHFRNIVPCGLAGRPVTSLEHLLADGCPPMPVVRERLVGRLARSLESHARVPREQQETTG